MSNLALDVAFQGAASIICGATTSIHVPFSYAGDVALGRAEPEPLTYARSKQGT
jgi:hypothetical protein